ARSSSGPTPLQGSDGSAQQEPQPELVLRLEHELVVAREVRRTLDLGDDGGNAGDLGLADDACPELAADDAAMDELVAGPEPSLGREQREPCRGAAAARRAVDLAVGEDGHVALHERRARALLLPEDHAVDVAQLGLDRVDDLSLRLELALDPAAELDQARQLGRLDPLLDARVERPAEGDPRRVDECGNVAEAD